MYKILHFKGLFKEVKHLLLENILIWSLEKNNLQLNILRVSSPRINSGHVSGMLSLAFKVVDPKVIVNSLLASILNSDPFASKHALGPLQFSKFRQPGKFLSKICLLIIDDSLPESRIAYNFTWLTVTGTVTSLRSPTIELSKDLLIKHLDKSLHENGSY